LAPLFTLIRYSNFTLIITLSRSLITVNIIVIITASTRPITPINEVGINKAIAARIDIETLATAKEALIKGTIKDR
jgi:hypothetical protein